MPIRVSSSHGAVLRKNQMKTTLREESLRKTRDRISTQKVGMIYPDDLEVTSRPEEKYRTGR